LIDNLAALVNHHGGDGYYAVAACQIAFRIHIHLAYLDPTGIFFGKLFYKGGDHLAGAAPGSPKIDKHRDGRLQHFGFKIGAGYFNFITH
jgi:hypothetical protein